MSNQQQQVTEGAKYYRLDNEFHPRWMWDGKKLWYIHNPQRTESVWEDPEDLIKGNRPGVIVECEAP